MAKYNNKPHVSEEDYEKLPQWIREYLIKKHEHLPEKWGGHIFYFETDVVELVNLILNKK